MIYDFNGVDKVHVYMNRDNTEMIYKCYKGSSLLEKGCFRNGDFRPIQFYNFLKAIHKSDVSIVFNDDLETLRNLDCLSEDDSNERVLASG
ncbi:MAG: hypothetical protein AABW83_04255 [Nanoarchaeota archaeon]